MPWIDRSIQIAFTSLLLLPGAPAQQSSTAPPATQVIPPSGGLPSISTPSAPPAQPAFLVVIDAAHGGTDPGAQISPSVQEKDVTLSLATHLRSMLAARGITVLMTRSNDAEIPMNTRAGIANHAQAAACLVLHATASGTGVHLFTSSLPPSALTSMPEWSSAQSGYVARSLRLSSDIDAALAHSSIPVILGRTFLQPLDSLTCPAVALEVAPIQAGSISRGKPVDDSAYQADVLNAVAAALLQWRDDWRQQP